MAHGKDSKPTSMWDTRSASSDYDPDEFYVRSTNQHDHSEATRVKLPKEVLAEINSIVSSKRWNAYRTNSDLVRDAIVHRLHYLAQRGDDARLEAFVARQMYQARIDQWMMELAEMDNIVKTWELALRSAWERKHREVLVQAIDSAWLAADEFDEPYASAIASLAQTYTKYLEQM